MKIEVSYLLRMATRHMRSTPPPPNKGCIYKPQGARRNQVGLILLTSVHVKRFCSVHTEWLSNMIKQGPVLINLERPYVGAFNAFYELETYVSSRLAYNNAVFAKFRSVPFFLVNY